MARLRAALLFGRTLPAWSRERVFEFAYQDLLGDYLSRRAPARSPRRLWLRAVFEARALIMALECWRVLLVDRLLEKRSPTGSAPPPPQPRKATPMEFVLRDLKYAVRQLAKAPVFTATAVLIVAIGIGANTAAFSVVNALLFRPQPFARPAELVDIYQDSDDGKPNSSSFPAYRDIAAYTDLFTGVAATFMTSGSLQQGDGLTSVLVEHSTANYMEVLGLNPSIGRWFERAEDRPGAPAAAVLSYRAWRERFAADPGVLGTVLRINGAPVTVVGVGPADYSGYMPLNSIDMWLSLSSLGPVRGEYAMATLEQRGDHWFFVKARMREGVTVRQVQEAMDSLAVRLETEFPEHNTGRDISAFGAGDVRMHPEVDAMLSPSAGLLMAIVGLVLLIACSNLANLLLVRAAGRGKEISIRAALGANRGQVVRQLLTESVLLSLAGGVLAVLFAAWAVNALMAIELPLPIPLSTNLALDVRVLSFALGLSVVTGVLFGLAPALRASRPDLNGAMRDEVSPLAWRNRRFGMRNQLIVLQVAVSFVLLVAAGLFVRSLSNARGIDPGFAVEDVAYLRTNPGFAGYSSEDARNILADLVERARALPGVEEASLASALPVTPRGTTSLVMEGYEPPSGQLSVEVPFNTVGARYFETLNIPLLHGRTFTEVDRPDSEAVAVVSEALAERYWGTTDAVGRRFRSEGRPDSWRRVVGVVEDTIIRDLTEDTGPQVYYPLAQVGASSGVVFVRTAGDPAAALAMMRQELRAIDADIPVLGANVMIDHLSESLSVPRMAVRFLSGFGGVALALASLGLYGVVSFAVGRRMLEVGVRMALGARSGQVVWLVLREVTALVCVGVVLGVGLSVVATTALAGVLFGVSPADPVTLVSVALLMLAVAIGAGAVPAMRAAAADPVVALRQS